MLYTATSENKMIHMRHEKISLTPAVTASVVGIASLRRPSRQHQAGEQLCMASCSVEKAASLMLEHTEGYYRPPQPTLCKDSSSRHPELSLLKVIKHVVSHLS